MGPDSTRISDGDAMTVAIGSVLLLLASMLLGSVLLLAAFGVAMWLGRRQRQWGEESEGRMWGQDPTDIAGRDGTSIVAPGK
jgi:hypothetical protein